QAAAFADGAERMQVAQFHIHARKPRGGRKKTSPRGQKESHGRERSGKSRIAASLSYQESPMIHRRFAFLLALGLALPVHAASGDAAHFYVYRMQSGAAEKFVAGDGADFRVNVAPYATPMGQPTYVLLREVSTGTPLENLKPSATMQVTRVRVRLGMEARFERALAVARDALRKEHGAPAHTWYRLVTGGESAQDMLLVARDGWAAYDRHERSLGSLLAGDEAAQRDVAEAVQSAT